MIGSNDLLSNVFETYSINRLFEISLNIQFIPWGGTQSHTRFLYPLHLPLQTLKMCAHTKRNIFTVPTVVTGIVSHTATCAHYLSLIVTVINLHFATPSVTPQLVTPTVITPPVTPSALSFICHHSSLPFICHHSSLSLRVSLHLLFHPLHSC